MRAGKSRRQKTTRRLVNGDFRSAVRSASDRGLPGLEDETDAAPDRCRDHPRVPDRRYHLRSTDFARQLAFGERNEGGGSSYAGWYSGQKEAGHPTATP